MNTFFLLDWEKIKFQFDAHETYMFVRRLDITIFGELRVGTISASSCVGVLFGGGCGRAH